MVETLAEAQRFVKEFAERNGWKDSPNIDKFDHLHEELIEMSQHLHYKPESELEQFGRGPADLFKDGIGDLLFGLCRLANQLGVDMAEAFNLVKDGIVKKYEGKRAETKHATKGKFS